MIGAANPFEATWQGLAQLLRGRRFVVLSGAGCSTESDIPDYRGPETARRARNPIEHRQFVDSPRTRQRYWARSMLGYGRVAHAQPNPAHHALAALEGGGHISGVVTQNVDGLHQRGGSCEVVELHGNLATASCLSCATSHARALIQEQLVARNPRWAARRLSPKLVAAAPDGDADVQAPDDFVVVDCSACGGPLKPDVVFFGGSVPRPRVERAYALVEDAEALLVVGSSLVVFSGFRFVRAASKRGVPIAMLNLTPTRGDALASLCVPARAGVVLPKVAQTLLGYLPKSLRVT